ncbi:VWA domain-containing protein [Paucibacter sp. APW11]|uniref:VWA domain-containing protein n=1 Tax=Roseateles aquae TaxID=3077235 RepID=A0ABU3P654_9BURK|nr:VWA domain-containing protein [Paucibacter sp. APW11]MDT8998050.1 VWA domain-containing protein [Paucibacter sp. APW11]
MEEWVGEQWHRLINRAARRGHPAQAVMLDEVKQGAAMLFRAAGGGSAVRVVPAGLSRVGGPRGWLQRLAGAGTREPLARLDAETLALPPQIDVFDDRLLNRELYLWLSALAASLQPGRGWVAGHRAATARTLSQCPGLLPRYRALLDAHLLQRPRPETLGSEAAIAERALRAQLAQPFERWQPVLELDRMQLAPVWLWLDAWDEQPAAGGDVTATPEGDGGEGERGARPRSPTRRRTRWQQQSSERPALFLPSKLESILTWSEHVPLDRGSDDEEDEQASSVADDMQALTLARSQQTTASRVKFDLDLPSASADDQPLGGTETLPEWDWKRRCLLPRHCQVQTLLSNAREPLQVAPALRSTARRVRRGLELLRAAPRWQRGCAEGEAIDLDAWIREACTAGPAPSEPAVYQRRQRAERSLATLLLADLSLSTDAYVNNESRVIDVIRDSLYVFGEALHGLGDAYAMLGFSSVRRHQVRIQHLKGFDEPWRAAVQARIGAIKPGYYTRMGAAIRLATLRLQQRPERQRLLLILTDGKPNDLDVYEGRWGIEDTRHAVQQARAAGLQPFCLSIDEEAQDYLPHLFGAQGWARVLRPSELPQRLAQAYARLTRGL